MMRGWSRDWQYFTVALCLWCFIPFVRRLLDWRAGAFASIQILSIVPLLALLPLLYFCFKRDRLARMTAPFRFFAVLWLVAFTYALLVGILNGTGGAGLYSYAGFVFPVIAGLWIATQELDPAATLRRLATIALAIGGVVGVYGMLQFVSPPPWDVLWVISANMQSVGAPEPFVIRVFSTMNSQGPCAEFLALALILGLPGIGLRALFMFPLMAAMAASLMLTLVRSAWLGLIAGVAAYIAFTPSRWRSFPMIAVFVCLTGFLIVSLPTLLGDDQGGSQIVNRLSTFNDLANDSSALDRQGEIAEAITVSNQNPLGGGLGLIGPAAKLNDADQEGHVLDSGYLARLYEMGYLGFTLYLFVVFGTALTLLARTFASKGRYGVDDLVAVATSAAICVAVLAFEAAGDSYTGITGLFAWLMIGTGFHWRLGTLFAKASLRGAHRHRLRTRTSS